MSIRRISYEFLDALNAEAARSLRVRQHCNLHASFEEPCQRLLNAIGVGSYIRPHRHSLDPKPELLAALNGLFALITFENSGEVQSVVRFGTEKYRDSHCSNVAVELSPATWHTVVALIPDSVLLELKPGPFDPNAAKELAPWAPDEGSADVGGYLSGLRDACFKK